MSRTSALVVALALGAIACGGAATEGGTEAGPAVATADPVIAATPPTSTPEGVQLPAISLTLADGTRFDFVDVDTPVMVVFWAEW